jgi:hypothetical protein
MSLQPLRSKCELSYLSGISTFLSSISVWIPSNLGASIMLVPSSFFLSLTNCGRMVGIRVVAPDMGTTTSDKLLIQNWGWSISWGSSVSHLGVWDVICISFKDNSKNHVTSQVLLLAHPVSGSLTQETFVDVVCSQISIVRTWVFVAVDIVACYFYWLEVAIA